METENQWNLQSLVFWFFFSCVWNCQQHQFEENRDLIKSTFGKLQGDPLPHNYTRKVTEMLFTRARNLQSDFRPRRQEAEVAGGRGWAGEAEEGTADL